MLRVRLTETPMVSECAPRGDHHREQYTLASTRWRSGKSSTRMASPQRRVGSGIEPDFRLLRLARFITRQQSGAGLPLSMTERPVPQRAPAIETRLLSPRGRNRACHTLLHRAATADVIERRFRVVTRYHRARGHSSAGRCADRCRPSYQHPRASSRRCLRRENPRRPLPSMPPRSWYVGATALAGQTALSSVEASAPRGSVMPRPFFARSDGRTHRALLRSISPTAMSATSICLAAVRMESRAYARLFGLSASVACQTRCSSSSDRMRARLATRGAMIGPPFLGSSGDAIHPCPSAKLRKLDIKPYSHAPLTGSSPMLRGHQFRPVLPHRRGQWPAPKLRLDFFGAQPRDFVSVAP